MISKKIVIFTPTYNRKHTLERCYQSIIQQDYPGVVWLVIDDGSTDNTEQLVTEFIKEGKLEIQYIYQTNGGKQSAWNKAVQLCQKYDLFICVDSDDILYENALTKVSKYFFLVDEDDVIGLRCLAIRNTTKKADSKFMNNKIHKDYWFMEIMSNQIGERVDIFKPQKLLDYLFPVNDCIKFIPESWMYANISKKYKFVYVPEPVTLFYDDHDHLRLSKSSLKTNAKGQNIARKAVLKNVPVKVWFKNPISALKNSARYFQTLYYLAVEKYENKH